MASSMLSNAAVATTVDTQAKMVAPFTGLKSISAFSVTKNSNNGIISLASNGGRVQCMHVWPPLGMKNFVTFSYLPTLSEESLMKEVQYLLNKGWVPCLEFESIHGFVYRENHRSPGYYDGRYWTMWKLPTFGCTDPVQVINELNEAKKAYPQAFLESLVSTMFVKFNVSVSLPTSLKATKLKPSKNDDCS